MNSDYSDELVIRYLTYMEKRRGVTFSKEEAQLHLESLAGLFSAFARTHERCSNGFNEEAKKSKKQTNQSQ